jgi:hypothetical protein
VNLWVYQVSTVIKLLIQSAPSLSSKLRPLAKPPVQATSALAINGSKLTNWQWQD